MHLIQILLPVEDNENQSFPASYYHRVREELTKEFQGLTAYTRAPAEGLWKDENATVARDDIIIFEVMIDQLDERWWQNYKASLLTLFSQEEIIIRQQEIRLL